MTTALEPTGEIMNIVGRHLAFLTLLGFAACAVSPPVHWRIDRDAQLLDKKLVNVAVLKVEDATAGRKAGAVLDYIRAEIEKGLITRDYTPLNSVVVDANIRGAVAPGGSIVEAGYLKTLATKVSEDAILAVRIKRWDDNTLLLNNRIAFDAEIVFFGTSAARILWSLDLWGEVLAGGGKAAPQDPARRAEACVLEFGNAVLARLPKRKS